MTGKLASLWLNSLPCRNRAALSRLSNANSLRTQGAMPTPCLPTPMLAGALLDSPSPLYIWNHLFDCGTVLWPIWQLWLTGCYGQVHSIKALMTAVCPWCSLVTQISEIWVGFADSMSSKCRLISGHRGSLALRLCRLLGPPEDLEQQEHQSMVIFS